MDVFQLYDVGRDDAGPHQVHCGEETDNADATKITHEGGHALRRSAAGRAKTALARTAQERVGLRRDLETCGRAGYGEERAKGTEEDAEARPRNTGQPKGIQETAGGGGGEGGGGATGRIPAKR